MPFDFHFLRPLWLLLLLPLGYLLWRLQRSDGGSDAWRGVVDAHLLPRLLSGEDGAAQRLPLILLAVGWLLLVLAVAGPTWQRLPQPLFQAQQYRVIALDLSPTMNAGDLKPSRLAHARYEVLDMLRRAGEGQTALLAYAAEPYVVSPLTADTATIAAQVPLLETGLLPVMGARRTDLALQQATELLRQAGVPDGDVILVTDGVEQGAGVAEAARAARAAGYRVSVLGVGTAKGAPIALPSGGFAKDKDGAIVLPRLDADALAALADAGGGRYVGVRLDDRDIEALLPARRTGLGDAAQRQDASSDQWREEGPWLLLLLLPLAALAFRRGWLSPLLLVVCVLPAPDASALTWEGLWQRPDQQALHRLEAGQATEAAALFERPDWRAAAHYQAGDYAQALQDLEGQSEDGTAYNRGNALARLGRLQDAVTAYDRALAVDPADADARHNRDLVQGLLDRRRAQSDQRPTQPEGRPAQDEQQPQDQQAQDEQAQDEQAQDEQAQEQQAQQQQASQDAQPSDEQQGEEKQDQQASQSADSGTPRDQGEQGEQDQQADQGGESSDGEQNASDQAAQQTGQGAPQPGEQDQGGSDSGQASAQAGADGADRDQAGQSADAQRAQQAQDAAGDRQGEERQGATGDEQTHDRQDPAGERREAARQDGQGEPGDLEQPAAGAPREASEPQGEQQHADAQQPGEEQQPDGQPNGAAQPDDVRQGEGQQPQEDPAQDGRVADSAEEGSGDGTTGAQGGDTAAQSAPAQAAGQDEAPAGQGGETASLADGQQAGADDRGGANEQSDTNDPAAPGASRQAEGPAGRPGLEDLIGEQRPRPPAQGPGLQAAAGGENLQALEQMLRRVEDDPGGLLRQRFLLQHLRRSGQLP